MSGWEAVVRGCVVLVRALFARLKRKQQRSESYVTPPRPPALRLQPRQLPERGSIQR
jgi:hypothetical protein